MSRLPLLASLLALLCLTASAQERPTDGLTVDGVILEPDGSPVVGAGVFVAQGAYFDDSARVLASTTTDAEGRFAMADVPITGSKWATLMWLHEGALSSEPIQQGASRCLRLIARPRGVAEGRIIGPDGQPVAGARVTPIFLMPIRSYTDWERCDLPVDDIGRRLTVLTDADGRYRFDVLEPVDYIHFTIEADGYTGMMATWRSERNCAGWGPEQRPDPANGLTLPRTGRIRGTLRNAEGEPVAGRTVRASTWSQSLWCEATCVTAEDGSFEFSGVPCLAADAPEPERNEQRLGDYAVTVDAAADAESRAAPAKVTVPSDGEANAELALEECLTVNGSAVDAESGEPVAGVTLDAYYGEGPHVHDGPTTGADGAFRFSVLPGAHVRLEDIPLRYSWPENSTRPTSEDATELEPFTLEPARVLRGSVRDDEGQLVASAHVRALVPPHDFGAWAVSLEDGSFIMYRDRKSKPAELVAVRDGLASKTPVLIGPGTIDAEINLTVAPAEPVRIRGRFLSGDNTPLAHARVTILGGRDATVAVGWAHTDAEGVLETAPLFAFGRRVVIQVSRPEFTGPIEVEAAVEPGRIIDLGDVRQPK